MTICGELDAEFEGVYSKFLGWALDRAEVNGGNLGLEGEPGEWWAWLMEYRPSL